MLELNEDFSNNNFSSDVNDSKEDLKIINENMRSKKLSAPLQNTTINNYINLGKNPKNKKVEYPEILESILNDNTLNMKTINNNYRDFKENSIELNKTIKIHHIKKEKEEIKKLKINNNSFSGGKVTYCSRECQFKDWTNHKNNCKSFNNNSKKKQSPISLNKSIKFEGDKKNKPSKKSRNISKDSKKDTKFKSLFPSNDKNNKNRNISMSNTNTIDSGTTNNETALKETQTLTEDKTNAPSFDFMQHLKEIIFMKKMMLMKKIIP